MSFQRSSAKGLKIVGFVFMGIVGGAALALLFGFVVMWLWNNIMNNVFGLPVLTYWQAVGILILAKIFFGAARGGRPDRQRRNSQWEKWSDKNWNMGPEDWGKFRSYWKDCGKDYFYKYAKDFNEDDNQTKKDNEETELKQ